MNQDPAVAENSRGKWPTNLVLTGSVILTIFMGLFMAVLDTLQMHDGLPQESFFPVTLLPIISDLGNTATPTPFPTVQIPTATPTPTATTTPTATAVGAIPLTPTATAVAVLPPSCGQIPSGWMPYTVQVGDTLFKLALNSGTTINEVRQANCLEEHQPLFSNAVLYLPTQPPERIPCGPPGHWTRYTVVRGDTMYSLAVSRGTTVFAVMNANCLSSSRLFAGKQIYLPRLAASPTPIPPTATNVPPTDEPTAVPPTATNTATAVPPTVTPTATSTPTVTMTPSPTTTATPGTTTPTATWTPTPTMTPTADGTVTPTSTATPTASPTSSPTVSPTPSLTPSPSPTPTATGTPTPTASPTPSPAATATSPPTNTPEPTATPAP